MPRAWDFGNDNAYYESLRDKVLADKATKDKAAEEAAKERRKSLGLPGNEHGKPTRDAERKSVGEKVMNFTWNGNRSEERKIKPTSKVGGLKDRKAGQEQHRALEIVGGEHNSPEIIP